MSKKNKHIEHLTPEIIQAYQAGELTSNEMYQVELLMLENPLYGEAMEGIDQLSAENLTADLEDLSSRIDDSIEERKVVFWSLWRKVAAVILVVITASGLFYLNQPTDLPTKQLTELKKPVEKSIADSTQTQVNSDAEEANDPNLENDDASAPTETKKTEPKAVEKQEIDRTNEVQVQPAKPIRPVLKPDLSTNTVAKTERIERKESTELLRRTEELNARAFSSNARVIRQPTAKPKALATNLVTIKGRVVEAEEGTALVSVPIFVKGTKNGTSTNSKGEFSLDSLKLNSTLVIEYLGFLSQEYTVTSAEEILIKLAPDNISLEEVVVTGVAAATPEKKLPFTVASIEGQNIDGSRRDENKKISQSSTKAKPKMGFSKYRRYLRKNVVYPQSVEKKRGTVTIEFTVGINGTSSDFKIIKGLGNAFDQEAIRLIIEGPEWNPKTVGVEKSPMQSVVKVKVKFKP